MTREGFSRDEIYDVLSGIGLPGEQVQLLIDRVAAEFHEAGLDPKPSRIGAEVGRVFEEKFEELRHAALTRVDSLAHQLELLRTEIRKLRRRMVELQSMRMARDFGRVKKNGGEMKAEADAGVGLSPSLR
jgi:hypothetical protein